jgi:hypothetical protein
MIPSFDIFSKLITENKSINRLRVIKKEHIKIIEEIGM